MPPAEPAVADNGTLSESSQRSSRSFHSLRVAVEADNSCRRIPIEDGGTVSTKPAGTVHDMRSRPEGSKGLDHRSDKDGNVFGHGVLTLPPVTARFPAFRQCESRASRTG